MYQTFVLKTRILIYSNVKYNRILSYTFKNNGTKYREGMKYFIIIILFFGALQADNKADISSAHYYHSTSLDVDLRSMDIAELSRRKTRKRVVSKAKSLVGRPYKYGGSSPAGFDCSGFSRFVFLSVDIDLPHGSQQQSELGKRTRLKNAKPGDLIFFGRKIKRRRYKITHVAIVCENKRGKLSFIHAASTGVRIDTNESANWESYWKKRVAFARRVI
jgi:probable lipoprotein NlpC